MHSFSFKIFYADLKSRLFWQRCAQVMRLNAPIGWILLALPGFWGYAWSCPRGSYSTLLWIILGAIWARSMGCFYNDWVDRGIDGRVERTRNRPLVASRPSYSMLIIMTSIVLLGAVFFIGLLPWPCTVLAALGGAGAAVYPWAKRWMDYPQVILALIFNLAVWMPAWIENVPISNGLWILYAYGILWTLGYDTVYAFQDWKDDCSLGVGSLAVKLGHQKGWYLLGGLIVWRFSMLGLLIGYTQGSVKSLSTPVYSMMLLGMMSVQLWKWYFLDVTNAHMCHQYFRACYKEGYWTAVWVLLLAGGVFI